MMVMMMVKEPATGRLQAVGGVMQPCSPLIGSPVCLAVISLPVLNVCEAQHRKAACVREPRVFTLLECVRIYFYIYLSTVCTDIDHGEETSRGPSAARLSLQKMLPAAGEQRGFPRGAQPALPARFAGQPLQEEAALLPRHRQTTRRRRRRGSLSQKHKLRHHYARSQ